MKKNGFVFIESIVVLVVVALSLTMLISSYSLISRKTKEKEHYDKASDKYFLYALSRLGTTDNCNYSISCTTKTNITFRADRAGENVNYVCTNTKIGEIVNDCESIFKNMKIVHIYVVENIMNDLNGYRANGTRKTSSDPKASAFYDNGTIEYLKTLKKCKDEGSYKNKKTCLNPIKYMIGVFERGTNDYYYASIEI